MSCDSKSQSVDKISVLRITSTFLKFQEFLKNGYFPDPEDGESNRVMGGVILRMCGSHR